MKNLSPGVCAVAIAVYMMFCVQAMAIDAQNTEKAGRGKAGFIENKGQIVDQYGAYRPDIDFKLDGACVNMFVGSGYIHYQFYKNLNSAEHPAAEEGRQAAFVSTYRMDVELVGANIYAQAEFEQQGAYYERYYLPQCPEGTQANSYRKVIYRNVYPKIDWVLYMKSANDIKYDFVIHPGGNPADIQIRYYGATQLTIEGGALVATTPFGEVKEGAPYSYLKNTTEPIYSAYKLNGNTLSFDIENREETLIIDPSLEWGTYFGGSGSEGVSHIQSGGVAADTSGNAIVFSETNSLTNVATSGAEQMTLGGRNDWILGKYNAQGTLLWATYYGGSAHDQMYRVVTDNSNNIYCLGTTKSAGLATPGAFQTSVMYSVSTYPSRPDTINTLLVKFNPAGKRQWATYYGDTMTVEGMALACDKNDNVWIGGGLIATDVGGGRLATSNAYQSAIEDSVSDGFVAVFNTSGTRIYGTYYPGHVTSIAMSPAGGYYIAGRTACTTRVASTGAHQTAQGGTSSPGQSHYDAFIARFGSGHSRIWGTYYGGSSSKGWTLESVFDAVCDMEGSIYVVGSTESINGIAYGGGFQSAGGGHLRPDGFISKFDSAGNIQWGSYYGLSDDEVLYQIDIGNNGLLYTSGYSNSNTSSLATSGAHKTTRSRGFMTIWGQDGKRKYSTYYGPDYPGYIYITGLACTKDDNVYLSGYTSATTGVATKGGYQDTVNGNGDAFLVQWSMDTSVYIRQPFIDTFVCTGDTLYVPYGVTNRFRSTNDFVVQLSDAGGSFSNPVNLKTITTDTSGVAACYIPPATVSGSGYRIRIAGDAPVDTSLDNIFDIRIESYPANVSTSAPTPLCSGDTILLTGNTSTSNVLFSWSGPGGFDVTAKDTFRANSTVSMSGDYYAILDHYGCIVRDTMSIVVNQSPENTLAGSNSPLCTGDTLKLTASSTTPGVTYAWAGPVNYNQQNVTKPNVQLADSGTYTMTMTLGSCSDTYKRRVLVDQSALVNIIPTTGTTICDGAKAQFISAVQFAGTNPQLQWKVNGISIPGSTGAGFSSTGLANGDKVTLEVASNTTCPGVRTSNEVVMKVTPLLAPSVSITSSPNASLYPNEPVTFTATPTNGGPAPLYQWRRNGQDIGGATGATWGANANFMSDGDEICVKMTSDYMCPDPDTAMSNCIKVDIRVSVGDINKNSGMKVYPNPVKDVLIIEKTSPASMGEEVTVKLFDVLGREVNVSTSLMQDNKVMLDMSGVTAGNYVLKVNTPTAAGALYFKVVKE